MNRSHAALLVGVLLLANPLYVDALVPGPTYEYQVHEFDPKTAGDATLVVLALNTGHPHYRGPTADVVFFENDSAELAILQQATSGYEVSVDAVPAAGEALANDEFVVAEVREDEWRVFAVTHKTTSRTFFLHVERVTARSYVEALAIPVLDGPPHVRELVREGEVSTNRPVRSVVFVDDGRYFRLDHDGVESYQGPLRILPWVFGVAGATLVGWWVYAHSPSQESVDYVGR